jgi:hypothetical protein
VARGLAAFTIAGCALAGVTPAGAQDFGYTAGLFAGRSHFVTDEVSSLYFFNSVDVTQGPFQASVSLPLILQRTTSPALTQAETLSGFGDPLLRVDARILNRNTGRLQFRVGGAWKPSLVGSDSGLGTGETDVAVGGSLFSAIGRTTLFADAMYWKYGDPEGVDFEDSVSYSVGAGRVLGTGRWSTLVSLSGFSEGIGDDPPPLQLGVAVLARTGTRHSAAFSAGVNLTANAGDLTIGISWRIVR